MTEIRINPDVVHIEPPNVDVIREAMETMGRQFARQGLGGRFAKAAGLQGPIAERPVVPGGTFEDGFRQQYDHMLRHWQHLNGYREPLGETAWDGILQEALFGALAEADPVKREEKLIELGGAVINAILSGRRERGGQ
ncbi:hypothetical protein ACFWDN_13370 [Micromonospora chalcea]